MVELNLAVVADAAVGFSVTIKTSPAEKDDDEDKEVAEKAFGVVPPSPVSVTVFPNCVKAKPDELSSVGVPLYILISTLFVLFIAI
jgi:hypothetical protein